MKHRGESIKFNACSPLFSLISLTVQSGALCGVFEIRLIYHIGPSNLFNLFQFISSFFNFTLDLADIITILDSRD